MKKRASGVLMHITSLPGKQGVGTFGQEAYDFVDFLVETDQTYWQILPLTTTSYGDSPYQSFSATAGNTHLIDLELLSEQGYLDKKDFETVNFGDDLESVDYARIFELRRPILEKAVKAFLSQKENIEALAEFEKDTSWLQDFADFIAIKEFFDNKALQEWDDKAVVRREEKALETYRAKLKDAILYHKVTQYFFYQQWAKLKAYANENGIEIIGDMPIYVSADSVEVWTMPELFKVDSDKNPICIAGVPADEFSDDGQLWEIQFMIGKIMLRQITLGGFTVFKKASNCMTFFVLTISKASQIIGKSVVTTKQQMTVVGNQVQDVLYLMLSKTNLVTFRLSLKTLVTSTKKLNSY